MQDGFVCLIWNDGHTFTSKPDWSRKPLLVTKQTWERVNGGHTTEDNLDGFLPVDGENWDGLRTIVRWVISARKQLETLEDDVQRCQARRGEEYISQLVERYSHMNFVSLRIANADLDDPSTTSLPVSLDSFPQLVVAWHDALTGRSLHLGPSLVVTEDGAIAKADIENLDNIIFASISFVEKSSADEMFGLRTLALTDDYGAQLALGDIHMKTVEKSYAWERIARASLKLLPELS